MCVSQHMAIYCRVSPRAYLCQTASLGVTYLPVPQRGKFAASLRDNRTILNHMETFSF